MMWETISSAYAWLRAIPLSDLKSWLDTGLWYGILFTALLSLVRIKTILKVITEFNKGKGPLWDLRNSVHDLRQLEPSFKDTTKEVSAIRAEMADLKELVEAFRLQLAALQVESISQRTGKIETAVAPSPTDAGSEAVAHDEDEAEELKWEKLREYWRRNTRRIEYIIEQIADGRSKAAYDRLPRTNYVRIIHKLQGQGKMTPGAANASKALIAEFNLYRSRSRTIPDEVVASLAVLDQQLDRELVPFDRVIAEEEAEDVATASTVLDVRPSPIPSNEPTSDRDRRGNGSVRPLA